jgi:hypothetical protein
VVLRIALVGEVRSSEMVNMGGVGREEVLIRGLHPKMGILKLKEELLLSLGALVLF